MWGKVCQVTKSSSIIFRLGAQWCCFQSFSCCGLLAALWAIFCWPSFSSFLVSRLVHAVQRHVHIRPFVIVVPVYILVILGLVYAAVHYVPAIIHQTIGLFNSVQNFYNSEAFANNQVMQWVLQSTKSLNLTEQLKTGVTTVLQYAGISCHGLTLFVSFILSFFFYDWAW